MLLAYSQGLVPFPYVAYSIIGAVLIIAAHKDNIARLLAGTETQIGQTARPVT
jgi:glycerol-3-phosphate acyltransferase PlsY